MAAASCMTANLQWHCSPAMLSSVSGVSARRLFTSSPAIGDCKGKCSMKEAGSPSGVCAAELPTILLSALEAEPAPNAAKASAACSATAYGTANTRHDCCLYGFRVAPCSAYRPSLLRCICEVRTWADGRAAGSGRNSAAISCRSCMETSKRSRAASSGTERGNDSPPMHSYSVAPATCTQGLPHVCLGACAPCPFEAARVNSVMSRSALLHCAPRENMSAAEDASVLAARSSGAT